MDRLVTMVTNLRPTPVMSRTPTTIPAQAQETAMTVLCLAPLTSASKYPRRESRLDLRKAETMISVTMAMNAARNGV